jgi:glycosyltransferase involved in cell wall biosynthesis
MSSPPQDLSIIVPVFNEQGRLPKALEQIGAYLTRRPCRAEVIVVDDGSTDDTPRLVQSYRPLFPCLRVVSNGRNRGKGFSVRHGMLDAQ